MIVLNSKDISRAITRKELLEAIKKAMLIQEKGDFVQPDRTHVDLNPGTLLLMPGSSRQMLGIKVITLFENNIRSGMPVLQGLMLLYDGKNGKPLSLLDGARLTALRTAAVGAVGISCLAPENVAGLGIVGLGVQGIEQALMSLSVRSFSRITLVDRDAVRLQKAAEIIHREYPRINIDTTDDAAVMLALSEVVITATNSEIPVLPDDAELLQGKLFVGIGSYKPGMRELPRALYRDTTQVFIDTSLALKESGDLIGPLEEGLLNSDSIRTLGEIIESSDIKERIKGSTIIYKSVGMALFDLLTAQAVFLNAEKRNIGQKIEI